MKYIRIAGYVKQLMVWYSMHPQSASRRARFSLPLNYYYVDPSGHEPPPRPELRGRSVVHHYFIHIINTRFQMKQSQPALPSIESRSVLLLLA